MGNAFKEANSVGRKLRLHLRKKKDEDRPSRSFRKRRARTTFNAPADLPTRQEAGSAEEE